ncbi:pentatricopeptide repeat-containing protein At4g39530-like [Aristolochia californica]|uniref:pentatricopeptide repeat-containing protein At4g39530-like n=1 Tax=Aristolochia californica TaxID=171875 RepID=UPI0035DBD874
MEKRRRKRRAETGRKTANKTRRKKKEMLGCCQAVSSWVLASLRLGLEYEARTLTNQAGSIRACVSANALVDIYAKLGDIEAAMMVFEKILLCIAANNYSSTHGDIEAAMMVFEKILLLDIVSWNTVIAGMGMIDLGRKINSHLIKVGFDTDVFVCVGLVDMYSKCGLMEDARRVFNLMPMQDLISWNSIISAYVQNLNDEEAISLFCEMQKEGFNCNQTTLSTILKSIASLQLIDASKEIHSCAIKLGLESDVYVTNSLIDAYGKCHYTEDARKVV